MSMKRAKTKFTLAFLNVMLKKHFDISQFKFNALTISCAF